MSKNDIGVIGMAVMGQNLVLNMNDHGYDVSVYNRTTSKMENFIEKKAQDRESIQGTYSLEELVDSLEKPRRVMLMIKSGNPVDIVIDQLISYLDEGDIIIDGGNSNFQDTIRRTKKLEEEGLLFVGTGISGGEEGARKGPSIMPGGSPEAWQYIKPIFQDIAAKVQDNEPCCDWVGSNGAGHYVKMIHNGIEYGDMQLIGEAYLLMKKIGMSNKEISDKFDEWNKGVLESYLIEITSNILDKIDKKTGQPIIDIIKDSAGQKGTGKWTAINALELGQPLTAIGEAVFARFVSALKDQRKQAAQILSGPDKEIRDKKEFLPNLHQALYAGKIVTYAQGFQLLKAAAKKYDWNLDFGNIALMWRGGCIIRSQFLGHINEAFAKEPNLTNILFNDYFKGAIEDAQQSWRTVVSKAVSIGIPIPALSSTLAYYDSYRKEKLQANLIQAQRDYFGAHTYRRVDSPDSEDYHTEWTKPDPENQVNSELVN